MVDLVVGIKEGLHVLLALTLVLHRIKEQVEHVSDVLYGFAEIVLDGLLGTTDGGEAAGGGDSGDKFGNGVAHVLVEQGDVTLTCLIDRNTLTRLIHNVLKRMVIPKQDRWKL